MYNIYLICVKTEGGKGNSLGRENRYSSGEALEKRILITKNLRQERICHVLETVRRPVWLE